MEPKKEIIENKDCAKPIKPEKPKDENISKMNKILSDNTTSEKVFDLLFVIDATGSMSSYINAAKDETENISKELRNLYPEYHFQYGYVFYRDPIDSHDDKHDVINLTDQANSIPEQIKQIEAYGGGDIPEDWVGAYKLVNEKINWRNGMKVIIHLADAGAHGKEFTLSDKYPEESDKLKAELLKCCQNGIKIFGYIIEEDARNSFNQCQNIYRSNGGSYEICEFKIAKDSYSDDSDEYKSYKSSKRKCKKKKKKKCDYDEEKECEKKCERKCEYDEDEYVEYKESKKCEKDESDDDEKCEKKKSEKSKKSKKKKHKKYKTCDDKEEENKDEDEKYEKDKMPSKQDRINSEFKARVLDSVKNAFL